MAKIKKIFLLAIASEILFAVILYFSGSSCGSACDHHSLLNPFGWKLSSGFDACIQMCVYTPNPWFYLVSDLAIVTIIGYSIYWIKNINK